MSDAGTLVRRFAPIVVAALALLTSIGSADVATRGRLLGIGAGQHVWWIDARKDGAFLLHALSDPASTTREEIAHYEETPEAIAAFGERAWFAFPRTTARPDRRDVVTLAMRRSAATGLWYAFPTGGELVASLPASGRLVGFAADHEGVVALLQPSPRANAGADDAAPRLLRLASGEWKPLEFPTAVDPARWSTLARRGDELALIGSGEQGTTLVATRSDQGWSIQRVDRSFADGALIDVAGRGALVAIEGGELRLAYLRDAGILEWGRVRLPKDPWLLAGTDRGAVIVSGAVGSQGNISYQRRLLAPIDAEPGPPQALEPPGFRSGGWIHLPLLIAFALATVMGFLMMRSLRDGAEDVPSPPPLPLERRAIALVIDLVPGAIIAMWICSASALDLLAIPFVTVDRAETEPASLAIIFTCLHTAVGEAMFGRSLGKAVVGGVVVSGDGSPARVRQILVRALFKLLTLSVPILACFVFFTRGRRSIGDVLSSTIVAEARGTAQK